MFSRLTRCSRITEAFETIAIAACKFQLRAKRMIAAIAPNSGDSIWDPDNRLKYVILGSNTLAIGCNAGN